MYIRLKNQPDIENLRPLFVKHNQMPLYEIIKEDLKILDDSYGIDRSSFSYGGYVILCIDPDKYDIDIASLTALYRIDREMYEFMEDVWDDTDVGVLWKKVLYLLGSDDSLMVYYPTYSQRLGDIR